MSTSLTDPGTPTPRIAHSLVGIGILFTLLVTGVVGVAHGARWMGLTHFGGIIHGAKIDIRSWSVGTPGIKVISEVEQHRGNDRYRTAGVMAWVYVEGQEEPLATYLSRDGLSGGGDSCTIGLWPRTASSNAATISKGVSTVTIHVEEVELPEGGRLIPIKTLGEFVVPVAR